MHAASVSWKQPPAPPKQHRQLKANYIPASLTYTTAPGLSCDHAANQSSSAMASHRSVQSSQLWCFFNCQTWLHHLQREARKVSETTTTHGSSSTSFSPHFLDRVIQVAGVGVFGSLGAGFGTVCRPEGALRQHQRVLGLLGQGKSTN